MTKNLYVLEHTFYTGNISYAIIKCMLARVIHFIFHASAYLALNIIVTIYWKSDHLHTFCILRNTNLKLTLNALYFSCGMIPSRKIFLQKLTNYNYNWYFIAILQTF